MKRLSLFEYANANPLLEKAKKRSSLKKDELFPFSCRGCGNYCCANLPDPIYVFPPEYIRIQWYFQRNPSSQAAQPESTSFTYDYEHVSGLPVIKLNFKDLIWQGYPLKACPFLTVREEEDGAELLTCIIHPARPFTCRIFPLGMTMEGYTTEKEVSTSFFMMSYCPGFESPSHAEKTLPGYQPLPMTQTAQDWFDRQVDKDQYEEVLYFFFEVMSYYYHQGWHLSQPTAPGSLTKNMYHFLGEIFYHVPDPPERTTDDHKQIMQMLLELKQRAGVIMEEVRQRAQ